MSIPHLNEPSLLEAINNRYNKNQIYTYTGKILISINPFQQLDLYNTRLMLEYSQKNHYPLIYIKLRITLIKIWQIIKVINQY